MRVMGFMVVGACALAFFALAVGLQQQYRYVHHDMTYKWGGR